MNQPFLVHRLPFSQVIWQGKSCGKAGQTTPLEIASRFPLFAQLQQQLDDPDHFLENPTATVASLRPLIGFIPEQ